MNKKAFTLIELLVVIVIIGMLAAFLMPVFGRAREGVRQVQCVNNLRQHGIAWYLYLDDHNDCFAPYGGTPKAGYVEENTFGGKQGSAYGSDYGAQYRVLNKYLDISSDNSPAVKIFQYTDDTKPNIWGYDPTSFDYVGASYCINYALFYFDPAGGWPGRPRPVSTIRVAKDKVWLERCFYASNPGHTGKGLKGYDADNDRGPVMVLFVDGHVKGPFIYWNDFAWCQQDDPNALIYDSPAVDGSWGY